MLPILLDCEGKGDGVLLQHPREEVDEANGYVTELEKRIQAVSVVPSASIDALSDGKALHKFQKRFGLVKEQERPRLLALLALVQAIQTRNKERLQQYWGRKLFQEREGVKAGWGETLSGFEANPPLTQERLNRITNDLHEQIKRRDLKNELMLELNEAMRKARLVIWWSEHEKRLLPGIYCFNALNALEVLLFGRIASPINLAVCERCGATFVRARAKQLFCSERCGNAWRQQRFRAGRTSR